MPGVRVPKGSGKRQSEQTEFTILMTRKYELNALRILSVWTSSAILLMLIVFFIFITKKTLGIIFLIALAIIFIGPFVLLFFNHFKFASTTKIIAKEEDIEVIQDDVVHSFPLKDVMQIIQYSSESQYSFRGAMWGDIMWWRIITKDAAFDISNLVISKADFKKLLKTDIKLTFRYFPFMYKKLKEN